MEGELGKNLVSMDNNYKIKHRISVLILLDILFINLSIISALGLRFDFVIPKNYMNLYMYHAVVMTLIMIATYYFFGLYSSIWRYASVEELICVFFSVTVGSTFLFVLFTFFKISFPRSFYILFMIINVCLIGGIRIGYRGLRRIKIRFFEKNGMAKRVMIIGGGYAGSVVIKEMRTNPQIQKYPVAVIDDDSIKFKRKINGVPILGNRYDIQRVAQEKKIEEIIIAMPSAKQEDIKEIVSLCNTTKCKLKTLPGMYELIDGKVDIKKIRDVEIEDLLGRKPIEVNLEEICGYIKDQVILVTGGGGSIGSELCRQIASFDPKKLLILDIYENNAYDLQNELLRKYAALNLEVIIASVRDRQRMEAIFKKYRPAVVFHAAAHKHVPLMEANPTEAIKNNVFGTKNVVELSDEYLVKKFVLISTDKAVNPTNIMGATKRVAEMIVQTMAKKSKTEFVAVRFGNVLGSNGSVIPLFKKQIEAGGPVTVTHPDIIRYFMTIPEAVQLVIQAGAMAQGGEIFILDMGDPVKIVDLAKDLIRLSGFEPNVDIKIEFTGLRPGEKLYEELLIAEEGLNATKHKKIFVGHPIQIDEEQLEKEIHMLGRTLMMEARELIDPVIKKLVPTYKRVG